MTIKATHGVIHQIDKKQHGNATFKQQPAHAVNADLNKFIKTIEERFAINKAYAFFKESDIQNNTGFPLILNEYLDNTKDFNAFSVEIGNALVVKLNAPNARLATGEHLAICDYQCDGQRFCLIALVSLSEGSTIQNGTLKNVDYIDSGKLKQAVKINIDKYLLHKKAIADGTSPTKIEDKNAAYQYLQWLAFSGAKDVVDYLQELMSAEHKVNDSQATSAIRNAVISYAKTKNQDNVPVYSDDEKSDIDRRVVGLLSQKAADNQPVYLSDVDDIIDSFNQEKGKQHTAFSDWRAKNSPNLESGFTPSKKTTTRWSKVKFTTASGVKINAEKTNIDDGDIKYDGQGTITIYMKNSDEQEKFKQYWDKMSS